MTKEEAKNISIIAYLSSRGLKGEQKGNKYFFSSPFSSDRQFSFCVYPTNTFYDWSTGISGDIIALVKNLECCNFYEALEHLSTSSFDNIIPNYKKYNQSDTLFNSFNINRYINTNIGNNNSIKEYGLSRGITDGYLCGVYFKKELNKWIRHSAMMFEHRDLNLNVTGVKFRNINNDVENRFSARGKIGFYVLENIISNSYESPVVYLVEGEINANSLWMHLKENKISSVVLSFGGVASAPKELPHKFKNLKTKIIIDYDGNEDLYNERIKNYSHLGGEDIKLILPKGEDINSLYCQNKLNLITNLI